MSTPLSAAVTQKDYLAAKNIGREPWKQMNIYLNGFKNGLGFANEYYRRKHLPMSYCEPPNVKLNDDNIFDIVTATVKREAQPAGEEGLVEGILLRGLVETFPCKP